MTESPVALRSRSGQVLVEVSLSYDKFSLTVSISGTLKIHNYFLLKIRLIQCCFSSWIKGLFYSMKLASFMTLTPPFRQFPFTIRLYDDATQASKSASDSGTRVHWQRCDQLPPPPHLHAFYLKTYCVHVPVNPVWSSVKYTLLQYCVPAVLHHYTIIMYCTKALSSVFT